MQRCGASVNVFKCNLWQHELYSAEMHCIIEWINTFLAQFLKDSSGPAVVLTRVDLTIPWISFVQDWKQIWMIHKIIQKFNIRIWKSFDITLDYTHHILFASIFKFDCGCARAKQLNWLDYYFSPMRLLNQLQNLSIKI